MSSALSCPAPTVNASLNTGLAVAPDQAGPPFCPGEEATLKCDTGGEWNKLIVIINTDRYFPNNDVKFAL